MATNRKRLTATLIKAFTCPPGKAQAFLWCGDTRGFGLRAMPDTPEREGTRAFVFQGRVKGTGEEVRKTLGRWGDAGVTVDTERSKAEAMRTQLNAGVNPVQAEKDKAAQDVADAEAEAQAKAAAAAAAAQAAELVRQRGVTLRDVADDYIAHKVTSKGALRAGTVLEINMHVDKSFAPWATLPVGDITGEMCTQRHRELKAGGLNGKRAAPAQAAKAMVILRALLRWAGRKYKVAGVPLVQGNPVEALSGELHKPGERTELIPPARMGRAFAALQLRRADPAQQRSSHIGADVAMFMLLTGARPGEACALAWDRVHLEDGSGWWHMPKALSKNGRDFWLPLSAPARALLAARKRGNRTEWVFPARSGDGHVDDIRGTLTHLTKPAGLRLRPHDLRRSYIAAGIHLGIELWKLELLTCHVNKGSVTVSNYVEKSRLQYLAPEQERIGAWIMEQAAAAREALR